MHVIDRIVAAVDADAADIVAFTADLVRIPTVNPPGEAYDACARRAGRNIPRVFRA